MKTVKFEDVAVGGLLFDFRGTEQSMRKIDDEHAVKLSNEDDYRYEFDKDEEVHVEADKTPFQRVAEMNVAFGNPKGDYQNIDWTKVRRQYLNIFDEYCEGLKALGLPNEDLDALKKAHKLYVDIDFFTEEPVVLEVRDALADQQVFKDGTLHFMGVDGDADMHSVIDGVMTRFIKDEADKEATITLHASKGVTDVYFEGEYPKLVMKSASDQPDAPKGKFLKSASYTNTVFPEITQ